MNSIEFFDTIKKEFSDIIEQAINTHDKKYTNSREKAPYYKVFGHIRLDYWTKNREFYDILGLNLMTR